MIDFFPRQTIEWRVRDLSALRRLTVSLVGMAVITGVVAHLYRWLLLSHRPSGIWLLFAGIAGGMTILLGFTTAHLGNHPVRQWVWRAPVFAAVESLSEAVVSAVLIAAGVERFGSELAQWNDWPSLALATFYRRTLVILVFTIILAAVVQWVRFTLLKREHRESTAIAVGKDEG
ncbi:MAG TPA: hypothetical protein VIQ74_14570 [Gemmatimonadaceae bacterium]